MKTLLNKIDVKSIFWDNTFLLGKIILVLTFSANLVLGVRIVPLFRTVDGEIVKVISNSYWTMTNLRGNDRTYDCMALEIDSFKRRIIHRNTKYSNLFKPGDEVKFRALITNNEKMEVRSGNEGDHQRGARHAGPPDSGGLSAD